MPRLQLDVSMPVASRLTRLFVRHCSDSESDPAGRSTEPDRVLVTPRENAYAAQHPGPDDVFRVVEVADTSLAFGRNVKLPLYAGANLPECRLVDLTASAIHVYRDPNGDEYCTHRSYGPDAEIDGNAFPDRSPIPTSTVLPPSG